MYTPRRTNLKFKILFKEDLVTISSAQQWHIYIIQIYIYFLKRKFTENMLQNTPSCAIYKKSAWGVCSNIPKYSVHKNTLSVIFYIKMNIFTILFLQNFSKTHQIHHFLKNFRGSIPPDPPSLQYNT